MPDLSEVASTLVAAGRGILAADESISTMSARLTAEDIEATAINRRDYRELLISAPQLARTIAGVILCDETFQQPLASGLPFPAACAERGLLTGVKVDTGTTPLARGGGATVTEGLDGLGHRLREYADGGAAFAKWRAVIDVSHASAYAIGVNAHALARYAALCQSHGIVPVVEPEVLCTGSHDLRACESVTDAVLQQVFAELERQQVELSQIVLKPSLVTPGLAGPQATEQEVASATLRVLGRHVPPTVPGIAFLSGGHPAERACSYLRALNEQGAEAPWRLTFSFGRALVSSALSTWKGQRDRVVEAQAALLASCELAASASQRLGDPVVA